MRLTVFGPTGLTGRAIVEAALEAGHSVRAYTRSAQRIASRAGLTVIEGTLEDRAGIAQAVTHADGVLSALGPARGADPREVTRGLQSIVAAMQAAGVDRLVSVSGAAVDRPGDRKRFAHRTVSRLLRMFFPQVVEAKQHELTFLESSALAWTAVRPPRIVPGPGLGPARASLDEPPSAAVRAVDLARFMVEEVGARRFVRQAPFVAA